SVSRCMCASTNTTSPPLAVSSAATRLPRSASRSAKATFAPSVTNRRTVASPIPDAPPVTAATFPFSRAMFDAPLSPVFGGGGGTPYHLVPRADIFGQNFRPGAAEKNGYGYEDLKKVNPKLVYVSISGYGPKGPHADLPGTDSMAQALGGIGEAYSTPGQLM